MAPLSSLLVASLLKSLCQRTRSICVTLVAATPHSHLGSISHQRRTLSCDIHSLAPRWRSRCFPFHPRQEPRARSPGLSKRPPVRRPLLAVLGRSNNPPPAPINGLPGIARAANNSQTRGPNGCSLTTFRL